MGLRAIAFLFGLMLQSMAALAQAETDVQMTPAAAHAIARQAMQDGQTSLALAVAKGLLEANPDDPVGLTVTAAIGPPGAAPQAGRRAFRLSTSREVRFEAAWLTGQAMMREGRHEAAKLWMRRAMAAAPAIAHERLAERSFLEAQRRSPLKLTLTASVGPSDNINGGSLHDTFWFAGLPFPISTQLDGGVWSLGASGSVRLSEAADRRTEFTFGFGHRGVWLSDAAKVAAPAAEATTLSQSRAEIGLRHRWRPTEGTLTYSTSLTAGRQWQGGREAADDVRLGFGADWQRSDRLMLSMEIAAIQSVHARDSRRDAHGLRMTLGASMALPNGDQAALSLVFSETRSQAVDIAAHAVRLNGIWRPAWQPMGISTDLTFGIEGRDFLRAKSFGTDLLLDASATFGFTRFEYMGFLPEMSVTARRVWSDFTPRDAQELGVGFGFRSKF